MSSSTQHLVRSAVSPPAHAAKRRGRRPMTDKQFALVLIPW
ncbi:hypothetical protein [Streptomyces bullii]|uniref:Transposase n=1 Tax=Streptomyces bullii TaxID=349910 RepID=A0ABW0V3U1_9ACTN